MAFTMTAEEKQWFHEVIAHCQRIHFIGPTCSYVQTHVTNSVFYYSYPLPQWGITASEVVLQLKAQKASTSWKSL